MSSHTQSVSSDEEDDDLTISDVDSNDDDDMMSSTPQHASNAHAQFFEEIPEEVRKLYDLRFTVCVDAKDANWVCIVVNNKNKKTTMQGSIADSNVAGVKQRAELQALIEALQCIYSTCDNKEFVCVEICTESVYLVNIVREWLSKWQHQLQSRPHAALLQQLWTYLSTYGKNIEIVWMPILSNALLQECRDTLVK